MKIEDFIKKPFSYDCDEYKRSLLVISPKPEYATGEVVLASTLRRIGFSKSGVSEKKVSSNGTNLEKNLRKQKRPNVEEGENYVGFDLWNTILHEAIKSPKKPQQSESRFLQISPLVPDASLYSSTSRVRGNSWNPGSLVEKIVILGSENNATANKNWKEFFNALSVGENDDVWARFLQMEFTAWRSEKNINWSEPSKLQASQVDSNFLSKENQIPAQQFVKDLLKIIELKDYLTRRQWISMIESILRIGSATHVLWLCRANEKCFELMYNLFEGGKVEKEHSLNEIFSRGAGFWRYGQLAYNTIDDLASGFMRARLGINLIILHLKEAGCEISEKCLSNEKSFAQFLKQIESYREKIKFKDFRESFQQALEHNKREIGKSKVVEFVRSVLGQRQTNEHGLESYDQGFYLGKKGDYRSSPWIVSMGPVAVISIAYACTSLKDGPATIEDFCNHLKNYGIVVDVEEVGRSGIGSTLRNLGLVLDSPDAEGGMIIINPFNRS
jgi:hypothetical protein